MKALTLHPEHAELFRLGIRSIETRSWQTKYRGRIALHAGMRDPDSMAAVRDRISHAALNAIPHGDPLTRGAIVATATLSKCLPIVDYSDSLPKPFEAIVRWAGGSDIGWAAWGDQPDSGAGWSLSKAEIACGDFTAGRWAWMLDDIEPLSDPIPARGRQGLWEWMS